MKMEEKTETFEKQGFWLFRTKKMCIITSIVSVLILVLVAFGAYLAAILTSDRIYDGVYIGELSVGSMTKEEAKAKIADFYQIANEENLALICKEEERVLPIVSLEAALDVDKTVESAFSVGRDGALFDRLGTIFDVRNNPSVLPIEVTLNEEILTETIQSIAAVCDEPEQENNFEITENELIVTRGHSGKRIITEDAIAAAKPALTKHASHTVTLSLAEINPTVLNADYIATEICGEALDAEYKIENYKISITDEKIGVSMDLAEAERCIAAAESDIIRIPVTTTKPNVTAEMLKNSLFSDQLSAYSTTYNAGDKNRSHNIALAASSINEIVLAPGDVFSYNDIVGPRTTARGYRMAHVYVNNRTTDGIGGGICQVSSTLYNAVVLADLEIVTRKNHSLPVSYVPMGRDATVSYGSIDFKFKNNTDQPVKLVARASAGKMAVQLYGNKKHPNRSVSITSECTAYRPAPLEQREDPTLPVGTVQVLEKGSNGSTYQTYKVISENGKVISRTPLAVSVYNAASRIEIVGTMPVDNPAASGEPELVNPSSPAEGQAPEDPSAPLPEPSAEPEPTNKPPVIVPVNPAE